MARGALMERLGLSSAEAASQLAELSAATGVPVAEMAAAVLSPDLGPRRWSVISPSRPAPTALTRPGRARPGRVR